MRYDMDDDELGVCASVYSSKNQQKPRKFNVNLLLPSYVYTMLPEDGLTARWWR